MQEMDQKRQAIIQHFVASCQADERVVAAFLGGSLVRDAPDACQPSLLLKSLSGPPSHHDVKTTCSYLVGGHTGSWHGIGESGYRAGVMF